MYHSVDVSVFYIIFYSVHKSQCLLKFAISKLVAIPIPTQNGLYLMECLLVMEKNT